MFFRYVFIIILYSVIVGDVDFLIELLLGVVNFSFSDKC